ncbi:MAG: Holliday junction branch migration protein RuvA [Rhodospirillales bacterium]|jgi:holliday junction DNA helicase RuvA|nr:Holliday junction branch migration protein RuvA [Rhodospirillales bacterium]
MIAKLTGRIDTLGEDYAIIDVSGVGYLVFCSGRTLGRLTEGEHASIVIETHVREDHIHLYGFMEEAERDWFKLLTTVQGVGAKVGLAILSALDAEELLHAIAAGDRTTLSRPSGVGPKLAARIASELKDKVGGLALGSVGFAPVSGVGAGSNTADAVSALVNLGYGASDALRAVSHVAGSLGEGADLEALIRGGLAELAPREHAS